MFFQMENQKIIKDVLQFLFDGDRKPEPQGLSPFALFDMDDRGDRAAGNGRHIPVAGAADIADKPA